MPDTGLTAARIADLLGGRVEGDARVVLDGVGSLDRAGPRDLSFLASQRYAAALARTRAGAVLVRPEHLGGFAGSPTMIVVDDPLAAAAHVLAILRPANDVAWGIAPSARIGAGVRWAGRIHVGPVAVIGAGVRLGEDCIVGAGAILEDDVQLGDGCRIGPRSVIHRESRLGSRVVLKAGACVGGPGFGFVAGSDGPVRFPHTGGCEIADDVEIGANATVDRGKLDATVIGRGTKIDNLVHIGHTVRIGARCLIMAQVGIAGSSVVEDDAMLAGQAGIADHVTVGRGARVAAQSGVIGDVAPEATVSGYPARSHREVLRQAAALRRLSPLVQDLEGLVRSA